MTTLLVLEKMFLRMVTKISFCPETDYEHDEQVTYLLQTLLLSIIIYKRMQTTKVYKFSTLIKKNWCSYCYFKTKRKFDSATINCHYRMAMEMELFCEFTIALCMCTSYLLMTSHTTIASEGITIIPLRNLKYNFVNHCKSPLINVS